ncbi:unnamed protein product [Cylicostephanus goldi]|uniref:SXP/RAL-2 family protein Ani s 5-like cation-binding domain-containing protein n=1 Tax=Cylicostephanus goldi TaxID=71465 RepID=A0A3P6TD07_CYLGO|nr:unnamed protein product [Cylicostephanus goldi]
MAIACARRNRRRGGGLGFPIGPGPSGCLGGGRRGRNCRPSYLDGLSKAAEDEYFEIVRDRSLTFAAQKERVQAWSQKYNITEKVEQFNRDTEMLKQEAKNNVTMLVSTLSGSLQNILQLVENDQQTPEQLNEGMRKVVDENPEAYRFLKFAFRQFMRRPGEADGRGRQRGRGGWAGSTLKNLGDREESERTWRLDDLNHENEKNSENLEGDSADLESAD